MPTYDFKCKVCGHRWEATIKMTEENPRCEKLVYAPDPCSCGGESEKVFGKAAPVHFHGKCWAKDGYK